ncbi:tellurite resistance/C4-dicarboxylate transporter family protein [Streptomyces sp. B6B3]|uniref:tellurite resistance/C4-dicarboxylate transporter family protein n=1 Tax=Streptomyces sp. B6B3 TaxID=3153570 RepID=UPI00325C921F
MTTTLEPDARGTAVRRWIGGLPPPCFALVMATGIVSRALGDAGGGPVGALLLVVAMVAHVVLSFAVAARVWCDRGRLVGQLTDAGLVFGFFTFVAASDVLAARLADGPTRGAAEFLLGVAAVGWLALAALTLVALGRAARTPGAMGGALRRGGGTWFLPVVGLQSVALAAATLRLGGGWPAAELAGWWCGVALYGLVTVVVVGRVVLRGIPPAELAPSYWVAMGAGAISVLTGVRVLGERDGAGGPAWFVLAVVWGWATCLLPVLAAAMVWRHLVHRVPVGPAWAWWSTVFPMGMYAVATGALAERVGGTGLVTWGRVMAWLALGAWVGIVTMTVVRVAAGAGVVRAGREMHVHARSCSGQSDGRDERSRSGQPTQGPSKARGKTPPSPVK